MRAALRRTTVRRHAALDLVARHPRHLVLGGLVSGLVLGPLWPPGVVLAAGLLLVLAGRPAAGLLAAFAVLGGAVCADARLAALDGGRLPSLEGRTVAGEAVLLEPVRERRSGARSARIRLLGGPAGGELAAARVASGTEWPAGTEVGEILAVRGTVAALSPAEAYQRPRGAQMALDVAAARTAGRRRGGPAGALDAVRRRAERALAGGLPEAESGLLRGMVLGQDEAIAEPVREEFRRSGLAHLLAASGQNVLLLAIGAIAVAAALGAGLRCRLGVALLLVALYVPLAGGGPSIQRAGVMGAAGLVAALAGRPASRWYALGLAAAVTLLSNPRAVQEPGWQLSFAAVVAMLGLAPGLRDGFERHGCPRALADALAITLAATLGTAPLMTLHFGSLSLASLPANLLAAPAVAPVMWLGMLAATVGQASASLAAPLSAVAAFPVAYVEWVAHVTSAPAAASVELELPGPIALAVLYAALGAVGVALRAALLRSPGLHPRLTGLGVVACLLGSAAAVVALAERPLERRPGELVISFLAVGQGDATLLQRDDAAVLVDTGPPGGPILRELRAAGVERLDLLVLTHAQADHEGMADAVLRAHPTRLVLNGGAGGATPIQRRLASYALRAGARVEVPEAGQVMRLGPLELRVLWPPPPAAAGSAPAGDPNSRAVVAHVRLGRFDLLLPADAESEITAALDLPEIEALKIAHHGSADPGLVRELGRLSPSFAAIEVGDGNAYGHPAPTTLEALRSVPQVARTDRDGTVRLRVADGRMRVERLG